MLLSMYNSKPQVGIDGNLYSIDDTTRVSIEEGFLLNELCQKVRKKNILEVGFGYGFSSIFILSAIIDEPTWTHTAIDPYQYTDWKGIGFASVLHILNYRNADVQSFKLISSCSDIALSSLQSLGKKFDLIFIDGYHRFDDVLVDFYLSTKICNIGGYVVLHDLWLDSIKAVASFINSNRLDFKEIITECKNVCVFQKIKEDQRDWRHYVGFNAFP